MLEKEVRRSTEWSSIDLQVYDEQVLNDPLHLHETYEVCLVLKGSGEWRIGGAVGHFRVGSLVVCPPKTLHAWRSEGEAGSGVKVSVLALRFAEACVPQQALDLPEMDAVKGLLAAMATPIEIVVRDRDRTRTRLRSIERAQGALKLARLYVALELLAGCEVREISGYKSDTTSQASRDAIRLDAVKRLVAERFGEDLTRAEAASAAGLEEAAFSRFFRRATGVTFIDYLANHRVRHAARLLGTRRDLDLLDIARISGFGSLPAFHRQFKRRLGTTPIRYRKAANRETMEP